MKVNKLLVALAIGTGAGSGAVARAQEFPFPTKWSQVLVCDGGALVVDVNTFERRAIQVVVNSAAVSYYLFNEARKVALDSGLTARFDGISRVAHELDRLPEDKLIARASLTRGVFSPADFAGFSNSGYSGLGIANTGTLISLHGNRIGADKFRLALVRERSTSGVCTGFVSPSTGRCEGGKVQYIEEKFVTDWVFNGCKET